MCLLLLFFAFKEFRFEFLLYESVSGYYKIRV